MSRKQVERRELWRQRIAQQEKAGQAIRSFCRERGLNEHLFYAWRQRLRSDTGAVKFALIETKPGVAETFCHSIELVLASGDRLRIPPEAAALRLVLSVLREQQR